CSIHTLPSLCSLFSIPRTGYRRGLHSFPTRRSSDLDLIRALCAARTACTYLDTHRTLRSKPELFRDAVHLNAQGYGVWIAQLRAAGEIGRYVAPARK